MIYYLLFIICNLDIRGSLQFVKWSICTVLEIEVDKKKVINRLPVEKVARAGAIIRRKMTNKNITREYEKDR